MSDSDFGDIEPEDSWHPEDPVAEQLTNLVRRAELLEGRSLRAAYSDPHDTLDVLAVIVAAARRRRLTGRELLRADQLDEDIAFIRRRL